MLSLQAKFGSDEVFDAWQSLRIAPAVSSRFTYFDKAMAQYGHEYLFSLGQVRTPEPSQDGEWSAIEDTEDSNDDSLSATTHHAKTRLESEGSEVDDIADILEPEHVIGAPKSDSIESWLRQLYESSRGFELGTFDATILATTMKKQSSKWTNISLGYVSDIVVIVHRFICKALDVTCLDEAMKTALMSVLFDGLHCRYQKAIEHVKSLLEIERNGTPLTTNHYINDSLE